MKKLILVTALLLVMVNYSLASTPLNSDEFWLDDVAYTNIYTGMVKLLANFVNGSETFIHRAVFSVTIYRYTDEILDTQSFIINNIEPEESRPIKLFFSCPNKDEISETTLRFVQIVE